MRSVFNRPAVLIILVMVLINAGMFFYFDHRGNVADQNLENQISATQQVVKANRQLIKSTEAERKVRTNQNCEFAERTHLRDVEALRGTYQYLEAVEQQPSEKQSILYKLVIKTVPRTIAEGETDIAPQYCDNPGLGLPEPDPVIPARPKFLSPDINKAADLLEKADINKKELFGSRHDSRNK